MKQVITYNKVLALKGYVSDEEYDLLISKYKYDPNIIEKDNNVFLCGKCNTLKTYDEMYINKDYDKPSCNCKDCNDKMLIKTELKNNIFKSLPTPHKDLERRFNNICSSFEKEYSSDSCIKGYIYYLCNNCCLYRQHEPDHNFRMCEIEVGAEKNDTTYSIYKTQLEQKCKFYKRIDFLESISHNSELERKNNLKISEDVITDDIIEFRLVLKNMNRKIKELKDTKTNQSN